MNSTEESEQIKPRFANQEIIAQIRPNYALIIED